MLWQIVNVVIFSADAGVNSPTFSHGDMETTLAIIFELGAKPPHVEVNGNITASVGIQSASTYL